MLHGTRNGLRLEQTAHLSGVRIHVNPPEGGVGMEAVMER
jgi:hypothetical protein